MKNVFNVYIKMVVNILVPQNQIQSSIIEPRPRCVGTKPNYELYFSIENS